MSDTRTFPDVEFVETDTEKIAAGIVASFEDKYQRSLPKGDPIYQFLMWEASLISQERSIINIAAKRNLPRYADGEYLDSLAEIFYGVYRQGAAPASVTMKFTLSGPQEEKTVIPAGTRVTADGDVFFSTLEELSILAGATEGTVMAECTTEGTAGNGYAVGAINRLVDQVPFVASVENTTPSAGGTDEETDAELYDRLRESNEGFSTTGTAGAYKYHVKQHNPAVTDVVITEPSPGKTGIVMLMDDGIPSDEEIKEMKDHLYNEDIRALTDDVEVSKPTAVNFKIDLTYYGNNGETAGGQELKDAVKAAVDGYVRWQTTGLGRRINPSRLIAAVINAGAARVTVTEPQERALEATECAVMEGDAELTYGGEDT